MPEPIILLDRYELSELIGTGGTARVYLGRDRRLQRKVAVKVLDSRLAESADPAAHTRFLREGRSSARFSHPHAVATYDAGEDAGRLFIVMEHVDGSSLAQRIADAAPLPEPEIVRVGTQLLSALAAAHEVGLIHRDVKPPNVLLDPTGTVKLADFGIARRFDEITSALTVEGMVIGTKAYLAPEQARGLETGPPVDIYAVGAVLYEMATGQRPPMTPSDAPRGADPHVLRSDLSKPLAAAISKSLAGRPADRFESAESMSAALSGATPTATMPAAAIPGTPAAQVAVPVAAAATAPMALSSSAMQSPRPTTLIPAPPLRDARTGKPQLAAGRWVLIVLALLVVVGGAIALARGDSNGSNATDAQSTAAPNAVTIAPPDSTPSPTQATAPPPTTPAPAAPAPTTPLATDPPNSPELIPGFPATDDVGQFIDQLRDPKSTAGKQSRKLGDGLRDVLKEDSEDRSKEIRDVVENIDEWLATDEIDPTVAARAIAFLAELDTGRVGDHDD
ncbi:MAG: serine/threonine-protein kinase [Ilumatobacteraceae bacterium]